MTTKLVFNTLFLDLNKSKNQTKNYVMGWSGRDSIRSCFNFFNTSVLEYFSIKILQYDLILTSVLVRTSTKISITTKAIRANFIS